VNCRNRRTGQSTPGKEDGGAETRSQRTTAASKLHEDGRVWIKGRRRFEMLERGQRIFFRERFFVVNNICIIRVILDYVLGD
jgi:hypothetical protein